MYVYIYIYTIIYITVAGMFTVIACDKAIS